MKSPIARRPRSLDNLMNDEAGLSTYHLRIEPKLWLATQRRNNRIYQGKSDFQCIKISEGTDRSEAHDKSKGEPDGRECVESLQCREGVDLKDDYECERPGLFGTFSVANGRAPLSLRLLSPAHRPIQTTRDLPGFWRGSWKDVAKDMRGRYPRHPWPENPLDADPTTRAKPRGT